MTRAATSSRSCSNPAEASARVSWAAVSYEAPSLFQQPQDEPLAARMRPRNLDEFIGQDHILGEGRLLRRAIQADQLSSQDRKSTRLNSSHVAISYAVFCL